MVSEEKSEVIIIFVSSVLECVFFPLSAFKIFSL